MIKTIAIIVIVMVMASFVVDAQSFYYKRYNRYKTNRVDPHWLVKKKTVTGKHRYYVAGWPSDHTCSSYKNPPTKERRFKQLYWYRPTKSKTR
jgi:hypothetical protein